MKKQNEYGGHLPIEGYLSNKNSHYFDTKYKKVIRLNCGRSCFYTVARSIEIKKIYIPYFTCIETSQPFKSLDIPVSFYKLDQNLLPLDVKLKKKEYLLWTNYYGNATNEMISVIKKKYSGQLIVDNCHAFFSPPLEDAFNCYSARKFIGVADGAYLVTDMKNNLNVVGIERDKSFPHMQHLFKQIENGVNESYELNLANEKRLENNYGLMSITTEKILTMVDYQKIKAIRIKNLLAIHSYLKDLNNFPFNIKSGTQMYYPFKCKDHLLKKKLLQKKVYSPTWWQHVINEVGANSVESEYTKETVLLPIDQRYDIKDMKILSDIIKNLIVIK